MVASRTPGLSLGSSKARGRAGETEGKPGLQRAALQGAEKEEGQHGGAGVLLMEGEASKQCVARPATGEEVVTRGSQETPPSSGLWNLGTRLPLG